MQSINSINEVFLELVRAGLWGKTDHIVCGDVDMTAVYRQSQEQAVLGLVAVGMERIVNIKIPQQIALTIAGEVLQLEQRNRSMNVFVARLIKFLRKEDIYVLLVKGQGIAQCYERPLWRSCGDIDLFLSEENYRKALEYLSPLSSSIGETDESKRHVPLTIVGWEVELHGTLRSGLWRGIDKQLDAVQHDVFYKGNVRSWMNGQTQVFLPGVGEDVVFVFAHILQHFFKEGIGLRQICDWCRLLWTFREQIDKETLKKRLQQMGVMSEWLAFASFAVDYLGMPATAMPFYRDKRKWSRKGQKIMSYVLESGNFGHNRNRDFLKEERLFVRKLKTLIFLTMNNFRILAIFPKDSIKTWCYMFSTRLRLTIKKM